MDGVTAAALGRPVAHDFRGADVAAGGEGAPLASFYHFACARWADLTGPAAFLNLGGVGNLTWLDASAEAPEAAGALLAFDTGPANAPIDDLVAARLRGVCDRDGALAAAGRVEGGVVDRFGAEPFLARRPPKSLDRGDFPWLAEAVADLADADAAATLTAVAAEGVARGLGACPRRPDRIWVTGGGRHNPTLTAMIAARSGLPVAPVEALGLDGDLLEAQAFAFLAVRVLRGLPLTAPGTTGVGQPLAGGRIARPGTSRAASGEPAAA